ncbi:hypothetical protein ABT072_43970 [Streptomyces sp. NPDC002589]|uniref:hypothetical protein n=1 Tax=Streptomyces sp. NPDC002589 TaxID=3154420 RepID=UPI00332AB1C9
MSPVEDFPAGLDSWTSGDWAEYRRRVADGDGSARAIDAVQRRRRRAETSQDGTW